MSWRPLKVDLILIFQQQMSDESSPADFIQFCILGEQFHDSFHYFFLPVPNFRNGRIAGNFSGIFRGF